MEEEVITKADLKRLPEYSCSLPTGTTIGKRWRRATPFRSDNPDWMIGEYVEHADPDLVGIKWRWAVSEPGSVHRGKL